MTKQNFYYPSQDGKTKIHAIRWDPEGKPKAILQIIHGMIEFIDRYDDFAKYLTEHGYLVCGEDHLGHGESVQSDEYHGYFGKKGNEWVIGDIHQLRLKMQQEFPDTPYLMLGHSMGSFLIRQYITEQDGEYAKGLKGVIVMGTGWQPNAVLRTGRAVAKLLGTGKPGKTAGFIDVLSFGSNLKKIDNPRTQSDWLTKDEAIVDWYRAQPWCTFRFSPNGYFHMFSGMLKAHDPKRMAKLPEGLPILFTSGAEDPVGAWGEGVRKAFMVYSENSPCEVSIKLYDGDRHEILNETDRDVVYKDMLDFLEYCLDK
ncbi:MAG: alpha/beta fold hydrolase [Mogibacterium sp.]|nr:alpha/beta fold hydrolase [Mogibacterium sp.]MBR2540205.1 alpha/beta fold hydrolase [Mogibacterium sp.]